ncbi:hypothetical protein [Alkalihalobacterium bogoriense]|uniref:hypothetical protein n=1 Tax=Alkalihalobacterium bogoriense TaxID=246272 RepID=UPI000AD22F53|nr:hypothetical protein [Alkalihalobacterium bogoriense]
MSIGLIVFLVSLQFLSIGVGIYASTQGKKGWQMIRIWSVVAFFILLVFIVWHFTRA